MRYLSWDEVCSLETFLAEDNDEAIGIELHTGKFTRETLYSNSRITKTPSRAGLHDQPQRQRLCPGGADLQLPRPAPAR